jgi:hypothetical protein
MHTCHKIKALMFAVCHLVCALLLSTLWASVPANAQVSQTRPEIGAGPAVQPEKGYVVQRIRDGLFWVSDGAYNTIFLVTSEGVIAVDAPPTLGANYFKAIAEATSQPIRYLIYSHEHTATSTFTGSCWPTIFPLLSEGMLPALAPARTWSFRSSSPLTCAKRPPKHSILLPCRISQKQTRRGPEINGICITSTKKPSWSVATANCFPAGRTAWPIPKRICGTTAGQ